MKRWEGTRREGEAAHWCGPWAIAVVSRRTYLEAYRFACQGVGRAVQGLADVEMCQLLNEAGRTLSRVPFWNDVDTFMGARRDRPTLAQWFRSRPDRRGIYVIGVTGHYVVVHGTKIICNQTGKWEAFSDRKRHKRSRVFAVWQIGYQKRRRA